MTSTLNNMKHSNKCCADKGDDLVGDLHDEIISLKNELKRVKMDNEQCNGNIVEIKSKMVTISQENYILQEQLKTKHVT